MTNRHTAPGGCLHLERVKATYELMGKDCLGNPLEGK